uniref:Low molecular weight phosphatase family protein n=2 Tax=Archaeoglobaceae TaxID=2232 RepID=A0A7C3UKC2_9EURY
MKKVLFVCVKNAARSVIAEAVFNSIAKKWIAESAGIESSESVDKKVREMLEMKGLKAKDKPRRIDELNLDDYDLIVTVCDEACILIPNKRVISWKIEDPVGKGDEVYERVFREIAEKVKDLVRELDG